MTTVETLATRETALALAQALCASAYWTRDGAHCTWMGRRDIVDDPYLAQYSIRSAALSGELYAGTAGIALFLADAFRAGGDPVVGRTARAAFRRSAAYMRAHGTPAAPFSLYAGHLGLVSAADRLEQAGLGGADIDDDVAWLVEQMLAEPFDREHQLDVVAGNAGAVAPLLQLARRRSDPRLHALAVACGGELEARASRDHDRVVWSPEMMSGPTFSGPPLTGYAHGASGAAVALLELWNATGDARYRDVARGAFAFEDSLYSHVEGNWIDARRPYEIIGDVPRGTFQLGWCHGAPGIAIARARAAALDGERADEHREYAAVAAETTLRGLERRLEAITHADVSLCHGVLGLSEALLVYGRATGETRFAHAARQAATVLATRYGGDPDSWPSGINAGGPSPALMVGAAGIGLHLLRVDDDAVPSPLIVPGGDARPLHSSESVPRG
jgi:lantibiotic modifying enzyme